LSTPILMRNKDFFKKIMLCVGYRTLIDIA
jgi:hypothetical protein